jgi:hypothetical protein
MIVRLGGCFGRVEYVDFIRLRAVREQKSYLCIVIPKQPTAKWNKSKTSIPKMKTGGRVNGVVNREQSVVFHGSSL